VEEKHVYVKGVGRATVDVNRGEVSGINAVLQNVTST